MTEQLKQEIEGYENIPDVKIFIDTAGALFWISKSGFLVWLHDGWEEGFESYVDDNHPLIKLSQISDLNQEGVMPEGTVWANLEFDEPFSMEQFLTTINNMTT